MARVRTLMVTATVLSILFSGLLAGCLGSGDAPDPVGPDVEDDENGGPETGMITLTVLDPGQVPFAGANVTLQAEGGARTETTNLLGIARFEPVEAGDVAVHVEAGGYKDHWINFTLTKGQHAEPEVVLVRSEPVRYVDPYRFEGFFDCSATYLIITGDCFVLAHAVFNMTGNEFPLKPTNEQFIFDFEVLPGWQEIVITQTWDEPEFALGSMMRVNLEPHVPGEFEHNDRYARAEGENPITMNLTMGELHPTASGEDMVLGEEGGHVHTRSFHLGLADAHDPGGSGFLGFGIAYQQRFTVDIEVHYESPDI